MWYYDPEFKHDSIWKCSKCVSKPSVKLMVALKAKSVEVWYEWKMEYYFKSLFPKSVWSATAQHQATIEEKTFNS